LSITLDEIAKAAGVSVSTASRALHNTAYAMNEATRQRIIELARDMGYSPNLAARGLRGKTTNVIGIVVENVSDPFSSQIVRGIIDQLKSTGFTSIIVNTDYDPLAEKQAVVTLVSNRTDGIIFVHASVHSDQSLLEIANGQPYVSIARIQPPGENTIGLDDYYGAQLATNHLLKLGRRRIAFISGPEFWWSSRERLAGYLDALKTQNLSAPVEYIKQGDWEADSGRRAAEELLALADRPDAIFAANDLMAQGAIYAIQDAGLNVPRDIAIVGHDDREFAQVVRPALSTVRLPTYEMGQAAAQMIRRRLESERPVPAQLVRGELIVRDSCGGVGPGRATGRSETRVGRDAVVLGPAGRHRVRPVPVADVLLEAGFWGRRRELNREAILPALHAQLIDRGLIQALGLTWKSGMPNQPQLGAETQLAQWMEAASLSLASHPDPTLVSQLGELVDLFIQAQHPDGYVNAYYTVVEPGRRFTNLLDAGELTDAGHLLQAAIAHHQTTGEYRFLNVALRYADLIGSLFGAGEHQNHGYPGYPGIEASLVDHYRMTGDRRYLELSRYFVNQRGQQPNYFEHEARLRGSDLAEAAQRTVEFVQAHRPAREQTVAVGHAGRAVNLYAAMADLAIELDDETLIKPVEKLYENVSARRMYVTGGIGSSPFLGSFTSDFDLPNKTASASTSAAIGLLDWMQRMLQINCEGRYADVIERLLYNGVLVGMSLDGTRFAHANVLKMESGSAAGRTAGEHRQVGLRPDALDLSRLLAALGRYVYAQADGELIVHHYLTNTATVRMAGCPVSISQQTGYPWDGSISIGLELEAPADFALKLRLPGWCQDYTLLVNGQATAASTERGYLRIARTWRAGDEVSLVLVMPVQRIYAHARVTADRGRVALQRGPVVYCLEEADNGSNLDSVLLPRDAPIEASDEPDLLGGVVVLRARGLREGSDEAEDRDSAYSNRALPVHDVDLLAVPYFAWDNRLTGDMLVWIRETGR
jgi:DUF1680 family protein/DNA-binding LacI/PurR family transcriptional regulator